MRAQYRIEYYMRLAGVYCFVMDMIILLATIFESDERGSIGAQYLLPLNRIDVHLALVGIGLSLFAVSYPALRNAAAGIIAGFMSSEFLRQFVTETRGVCGKSYETPLARQRRLKREKTALPPVVEATDPSSVVSLMDESDELDEARAVYTAARELQLREGRIDPHVKLPPKPPGTPDNI